jgi:nitrite reductase/ring-hydroxylating ferredoxin subunit
MPKVLKIKIFIVSALVLLITFGCRKDTFKFPNVNVYASLGISSDLGDLGAGSIKKYPPNKYGDVGGLIIYMDYDGYYFAFDAACTFDYLEGGYTEKGELEGFVKCPLCNSIFQLYTEGNDVFQGPARYPLVQYQAFVNGGFLVVNN